MENGKFEVNEGMNQFELHVDGKVAFLEYIKEGSKIHMTHTEAPEELQGTGAAQTLVKKALEYSKENNLTVVPSCSYVAHYVNKHPEWRELLSDGYQM
jgi:predicted GNAT family acetyltransferase